MSMPEPHRVTAEFYDRGSATRITAEVKIARVDDPDVHAPVVIRETREDRVLEERDGVVYSQPVGLTYRPYGDYRLWRGQLYRQVLDEVELPAPRSIADELEELADDGSYTDDGPHADADEWHSNLDGGYWPSLIDIEGVAWTPWSVPCYVVDVESWPGRRPGMITEVTSPTHRKTAVFAIIDLAGARDLSRRIAAAVGHEPAPFTPKLEVVRPDLLPYTKPVTRPDPEVLWLREHVAAAARTYSKALDRCGLGSHEEVSAFSSLVAARTATLPD